MESNPVRLDELAMHAFVAEIVDAIDNVAMAAVWDPSGQVAWSQTFQNNEIGLQRWRPRCDTEAVKSAARLGYTAYDFPLDCENASGYVFSLLIHSVDPPDLASVSFSIGNVLTCLARQVDIDCMLTTNSLIAVQHSAPPSLTMRFNALAKSDDLPGELQKIVNECVIESSLAAAVVAIPAQKILAVAHSDQLSRKTIVSLLTRLQEPLNKKRKVISATVSLETGVDGYLYAAPILRTRKSLQGIAFVVNRSADTSLVSTIRSIANRVSTVSLSGSTHSKLLTRFELVALIDGILSGQPTLPHSLIYFDTDKMHTINDAFGYTGGDRALSAFRRILTDSSGANDSIAHLGSDRFALFMPGASGDTAVAKAEQVLRLLSQEAIDDERKAINLSASAGAVDTNAADGGAEDMLILAEVASRGAQDRGGNQCAFFQDIDSSIIQRRSDVDKVGYLQMALIENQFELHAQRIQSLGDNSGQKYELLARLDTPDAPNRSPAEFLSAAERYQLMSALDRWVINAALSTMANAENPLEVSLSTFAINISAQSLQDDAFVEFIESRIAETGVAPDTLCFEITETSLVRYLERAQRFVHRLQRLGCQVALDDFGTGYSSFAYLKTLPVNYLKIDGAFVRDLLENDLSKAIVRASVNIADVIGAQTVAEHVENPMVQAWLKDAGVHFVQGFAVHKPEPFREVLAGMDSIPMMFDTDAQLDLRVDALKADKAS